jgi:hypothetical protein
MKPLNHPLNASNRVNSFLKMLLQPQQDVVLLRRPHTRVSGGSLPVVVVVVAPEGAVVSTTVCCPGKVTTGATPFPVPACAAIVSSFFDEPALLPK